MVKKSMTVKLKGGLEARPIAELVQVASKYDSRIYIELGTKRVNAKSIMGMMSLELDNGDEMTVSADGSDEQAAIDEIEQFVTAPEVAAEK
ncbi:MAG TPA: HPr family phosphocarrier protein [Lachnospiraceae bacterium]|jgi:phosphotransferase system HPr (HPr) family protein|nr:HPr family phosphocarrier protein [Lachnospiraceae bacterium]